MSQPFELSFLRFLDLLHRQFASIAIHKKIMSMELVNKVIIGRQNDRKISCKKGAHNALLERVLSL